MLDNLKKDCEMKAKEISDLYGGTTCECDLEVGAICFGCALYESVKRALISEHLIVQKRVEEKDVAYCFCMREVNRLMKQIDELTKTCQSVTQERDTEIKRAREAEAKIDELTKESESWKNLYISLQGQFSSAEISTLAMARENVVLREALSTIDLNMDFTIGMARELASRTFKKCREAGLLTKEE